jgi:DNA-binding MarR family transcriptional regulator
MVVIELLEPSTREARIELDYLTSEGVYGTYIKIMTARAILYKMRSKELRTIGISPESAAILLMVKNANNNITPAEIARSFYREPHTVSQILKRMAKRGLLALSKDLERRNMIRVSLTEEGERIFALSLEKQRVLRALFSQFNENEYKELIVNLENLTDKGLKTLKKASSIIHD